MTNPYYEPYWAESSSDSLEHYGVKGMKWGVRRYQDQDGKRMSKARETYNAAKSEYDKARKKRNTVERVKARKNLKEANRNLKRARLADEGEKLSKAGYGIYGMSYRNAMHQFGLEFGMRTVTSFLSSNYGNSNAAYLSAKTVEVGTRAVQAALWGKTLSDVAKLDAYEKYGNKRKW